MSYMRGRFYLWRDDRCLHLWAADGYDGWDDSVWHEPTSEATAERGAQASGVAIPIAAMDEYVAMRLAQLLEGGELSDVIDRALAKHSGNGGCMALQEQAARIKTALSHVSAA